jgi:hypothetical protein
MKSEIEQARAREVHTSELAAGLRHARERLALYKAKSYGPRLTSPARLRELERASELAETRLQRAQTGSAAAPFEKENGSDVGPRGETDAGVEFE